MMMVTTNDSNQNIKKIMVGNMLLTEIVCKYYLLVIKLILVYSSQENKYMLKRNNKTLEKCVKYVQS